MAQIELRPVRVRTGSRDTEGRLVMVDGELVAVLVRLDDPIHGGDHGAWFLEAVFGPYGEAERRSVFPDLEEASGWVRSRIRR